MTEPSEYLRNRANALYIAAQELDDRIGRMADARDLLNKLADEMAEQASVATEKEKPSAE
jgi:acetyl-CoA carboxylase carboxyltransferase component